MFNVYVEITLTACLILIGGVLAGLTIGFMGQDNMHLAVISESGDIKERKDAQKVLRLLSKRRYWVLVTLLISNVIISETLPVFLDHALGKGVEAVVISAITTIIFGEIIPQAVCVKHGLKIGAFFVPFVLFLMYLMYPLVYPCAYVLNYFLGDDQIKYYKKSGLKSLMSLHRKVGTERLTDVEVDIIKSVLDLKDKPVTSIMTSISDIFSLSSDEILDSKTLNKILFSGFSKIPVHYPDNPLNFLGLLNTSNLINCNIDDETTVGDCSLSPLSEISSKISCLSILAHFQKSIDQMLIVCQTSDNSNNKIGIVTLNNILKNLLVNNDPLVTHLLHKNQNKVTSLPPLYDSQFSSINSTKNKNLEKKKNIFTPIKLQRSPKITLYTPISTPFRLITPELSHDVSKKKF